MKTMHWLKTVSAAVVLTGAFSAQALAAQAHGNTPPAGDPKAGEAKANTICMACHGPQGNSIVPTWPKVAGQHPDYTYKQLMDFKSGNRQNAQMSPMAAPLSEQEMRDLAAYYATQTQTTGAADPELATLGEQIYRAGNPQSGVPACSGCHGPAGMGMNLAKFPRISGQHADYTKQTLTHFRTGERANDLNAMMRGVAAKMTDKEIAAVSQYLQGLDQ